MKAAPLSWRETTARSPPRRALRASALNSGSTAPPGTPNTYSTPAFSRQATISSAASIGPGATNTLSLTGKGPDLAVDELMMGILFVGPLRGRESPSTRWRASVAASNPRGDGPAQEKVGILPWRHYRHRFGATRATPRDRNSASPRCLV